ncbi:hypothetical protein Tco_0355006 [Tanacetum coccineum]
MSIGSLTRVSGHRKAEQEDSDLPIYSYRVVCFETLCQVKDNKIDLLVQQYEQFMISEVESIDNAFAGFNTIITSLKVLDEDLTSLSLDELIGNLKVYEVIIKKDSEMVKGKREQSRSLSLKAKRNLVMKIAQPLKVKTKNTPWPCGDLNHLIEECPKLSRNNNQRAFIEGAWSDSGEDKVEKNKDETCLVAQASNEIYLGINL